MRFVGESLTFDDVLLRPGPSQIGPSEANLRSEIAGMGVALPFVSSAMDTVTERDMAIAMAEAGGLGVIHKALDRVLQIKQVKAVKRRGAGVLRSPTTIDYRASVGEARELTRDSGYSGVPVVEGRTLVGIVTHRDLRLPIENSAPITSVMTKRDNLVTVSEGQFRDSQALMIEAERLMNTNRIEKVLIVGKDNHLTGMVTLRDIKNVNTWPNATRDAQGRLMVAAAIGVGASAIEHAQELHAAGVDAVVVDSAHGHAQAVVDTVRQLCSETRLRVIAGNVATADGAKALADAGASCVKVGIGPGSICTTRIVTGVGVPQLTAVIEVVNALKGSGVSVISDGGIRASGDVVKALAAGASAVMLGSALAGTDEAPGETIILDGRSWKAYRGMGSLGAMSSRREAAERYFQGDAEVSKLVPEGVEGRVPYRGPVRAVLDQLSGGLRSGMGYVGAGTLEDLHDKAEFVRVTPMSMQESHVHSVRVTREAPNYDG